MKKNKFGVSFAVCALLIPVVFMLYFYQNGQNALYVKFSYLAAVMAALAAVSLVIWLVSRIVFRSPFAAYIMSFMFFIALFSCNAIAKALPFAHYKTLVIFAAFMLIGLLLALLIRRKERISELADTFVAVFTAVMLLFNLIPAVKLMSALGEFDKQETVETENDYIKTEFNTDAETDSPNIYWIHCDGMVGFDTIEKYFGDSRQEAYDELTEMGFYINRSAKTEVLRHTYLAVPSLMCPEFYDANLAHYLEDDEMSDEAKEETTLPLLDKLAAARWNNEFQQAFLEKGYCNNVIVPDDFFASFFPKCESVERYYCEGLFYKENYLVKNIYQANITDLVNFCDAVSSPFALAVSRVTRLDPEEYAYNEAMSGESLSDEKLADILKTSDLASKDVFCREINNVYDIMTSSQRPYCVLYCYAYDHQPFYLDENGNMRNDTDKDSIFTYYENHKYVMKVLVNLVEMIRENDPEAVIVLQADHGTHTLEAEELIADTGSETAPDDFWNQVMSAVYIPEKYRTEDYEEIISNPLNISRYIINTFVGNNYEYR